MENQQSEMNFFDLCVLCGRGIGRLLKKAVRLVGKMVRLTFRYSWIVLPVLGLFIGWGIYHTRPAKQLYPVHATLFLNGSSVSQFELAFEPLHSCHMTDTSAIAKMIADKQAQHFETFRIIDAKNDGTEDFVDYKGKFSPMDTTCVRMEDRIHVRFYVAANNLEAVPQIETAMMDWLNSNEVLVASHQSYVQNLDSTIAFNHRQIALLEKMVQNYSEASHRRNALKPENGDLVLTSESKIDLSFYKDIEKQRAQLEKDDYRKQFAATPVTLENHFVVGQDSVNSRKKMLPRFILFGWVLGCAMAAMVEQRKSIYAWLKK